MVGSNNKFFDMYKKKALSKGESLSGSLLSPLNAHENHWCSPQFGIDERNEVIDNVCTCKHKLQCWRHGYTVSLYLFIYSFIYLFI